MKIVNAARASFEKKSLFWSSKDERLMGFLAREEHTSPLRHAVVSFEVYAPLMVARQLYKHAVASSQIESQFGWNESSRRYVTEEPVFYVPGATEWRSAPDNLKQGSGSPVDARIGALATKDLMDYIDAGTAKYEYWMKAGVAPEQARLFLPAYGMYVRWEWTASVAAVIHMLNLRLAHDTQGESREYAGAIRGHMVSRFPLTCKYFLNGENNG